MARALDTTFLHREERKKKKKKAALSPAHTVRLMRPQPTYCLEEKVHYCVLFFLLNSVLLRPWLTLRPMAVLNVIDMRD